MKKMQTKQATLLGLRTPEQEYWEIINGNYSFSEALQILEKIDWDFKDFTTLFYHMVISGKWRRT